MRIAIAAFLVGGWALAGFESSTTPPDPCADVNCGAGEVCVDGVCESPDPCSGVECASDRVCVDGECVTVDPCAGVTCPTGQHCDQGLCVADAPTGESDVGANY